MALAPSAVVDPRPVDHAGAEPAADLETRILDATLALVGRWGVGKTSLADVAKEAGCARATVYRAFPGGKQQLLTALGGRELASYIEAITEAIDSADELADAVTRGLVVAARLLRDNDAAQFVVAHEPELLVPFLGFKQVDRLYTHVSATVGPHLERFVPADRASWLAEWAARAFITYLFNPDPDVDLAVVEHTRRLVSSFVIPAFEPVIDLHPTNPHPSPGSSNVHH
jgi:AcrR family transcriptional regulator